MQQEMLYSGDIPWPPTVRSLQCVMSFYVDAWFTWNSNVLLPSFPVTNHTIGARHLASRAFKNEGNNADLCKSHWDLRLELACVNLQLPQSNTDHWRSQMPAQHLTFFCVFTHFSAPTSLETHEAFTEHKSDSKEPHLFIALLPAEG